MRTKTASTKLIPTAANLIMSSGLTAALGFLFWLIVARDYRPETVGLATSAFSVSTLLSLIGLTGFDSTLIKFLPSERNRSGTITASFIVTGGASAALGATLCLIIPSVITAFTILRRPVVIFIFCALTVFTTWNILTNTVLLSCKLTFFIVIANVAAGATKLAGIAVLPNNGTVEILLMLLASQVVNVAVSVAILIRRANYRITTKVEWRFLRHTFKYGIAVWAASLLNLAPDSLLPLIVIGQLGAAKSAYFYVAFTLANMLYTLAFSVSQSLFAAASQDIDALPRLVKHALITTTLVLAPCAAFLVWAAPWLLNLFSHTYEVNATELLRLLVFSGFPAIGYTLLLSSFKLRAELSRMISMTAVNATVIIGLSLWLSGRDGLSGVGFAWLIGTVLAVLVGQLAPSKGRRS